MNSVYNVNKGINKPVEFKGLKAQYIWYLGGGMVALMAVFAILYIIGINSFICVGFALVVGTVLISYVYKLSNRYGEHGLKKKIAKRYVPKVIKSRGRKAFITKQ